MAAPAEVIQFRTYNQFSTEIAPQLQLVSVFNEPPLPQTAAIPAMESDRFTRLKATKFIGRVMTGQTVQSLETSVVEQPIDSLHSALQLATDGNAEAIKLIDINVGTDMIERTIKVGHVMDPVWLKVLPGSKVVQYGQTGDVIQANSLQLLGNDTVLGPRTKAETNNHFRIEDLHRANWFDENSMLIISLAENDSERFFTKTMSVALQLVSKAGDDLQLEAAFVAGIAESGAACRDIDIVIALGDIMNVDFRNLSKAEIIDTPIKIPNSLLKNGVIDIVKLWDKAATAVLGTKVFFGEHKTPPATYEDYLETCRQRTKTFEARKIAVRNQLIAESKQIRTRVQATERLHELSAAQMVEKAVEDHSIDARVFGPVSAAAIEQARAAQQTGDFMGVRRFTKVAQQTETSLSCPTALKIKEKKFWQ